MTTRRIAEINALLENLHNDSREWPWEAIGYEDEWAVRGPHYTGYEGEMTEETARFIAAAPAIIDELLAALQAQP